jgi:hypothetical protein
VRPALAKLRTTSIPSLGSCPSNYRIVEHASSLREDWLSADGVARNQKFESSSLQRTVSVSDRLDLSRSRTTGFPRVRAAGLAARSGVSRDQDV